jgi:hypothetical protein
MHNIRLVRKDRMYVRPSMLFVQKKHPSSTRSKSRGRVEWLGPFLNLALRVFFLLQPFFPRALQGKILTEQSSLSSASIGTSVLLKRHRLSLSFLLSSTMMHALVPAREVALVDNQQPATASLETRCIWMYDEIQPEKQVLPRRVRRFITTCQPWVKAVRAHIVSQITEGALTGLCQGTLDVIYQIDADSTLRGAYASIQPSYIIQGTSMRRTVFYSLVPFDDGRVRLDGGFELEHDGKTKGSRRIHTVIYSDWLTARTQLGAFVAQTWALTLRDV